MRRTMLPVGAALLVFLLLPWTLPGGPPRLGRCVGAEESGVPRASPDPEDSPETLTVPPAILAQRGRTAYSRPVPQWHKLNYPKSDPSPRPVMLPYDDSPIFEKLASKTSIQAVDTALADVVAELADRHEMLILFDRGEVEQVLGLIPEETPVTRDLSNLSLRSTLDLLLTPLEMTWVIRGEVLLLTTQEKADSVMLSTRVYDVADLIARRDEEGRIVADYVSLEVVITAAVKPYSWEEVGGPGTVTGLTVRGAEILVVRQTFRAHEEITQLLEDHRAVARKNRLSQGNAMPPETEPPTPRYGGMRGGMGGGGGW
ncbi:MAG: hypothetical protein HQ581_20630 [Planctomycetes bacterium]|nr:hypothetical protein [Planctomycetota bacterium]